MFAEVFGGKSLEVSQPLDPNTKWENILIPTFNENYEKALQQRERIYTQIREYASLVKHTGLSDEDKSYINLKQISSKNTDAVNSDKTKFLSYYMDASYISSAMKSFPSTYNPVTGAQLADYNRNRSKFLEDYASGKYDKKKA